jgi:hypothetical protein
MIRRQSEWDFLLKFLILRMNESVKANVGCQEACELHELLLRNFKPLNAICPCSNVCDIDSLPTILGFVAHVLDPEDEWICYTK